MRERGEPDRRLRRLAAAQSDVVTREQAESLGLSRHTLSRMVERGVWQRLSPGLFLTHNTSPDWTSLAWAGVLLGGDQARLGGTAAAFAGRLLDEPPQRITILVPHRTAVRDREPWAFVRERPGARSTRTTGSPPRTLLPDTVLDLCDQSSVRQVENLVTQAVQRQLTTPAHILRALDGRSRHSRRSFLRALLAEVSEGAESPLELRYLRNVERRHGLPDGTRQRRSVDGKVRRDVLYRPFGLVVELDGKKGHVGSGQLRDMRRDNAALRQRLVTLRYGFGDVYDQPCAVAEEVAAVLGHCGWTGLMRRCPSCPPRPGEF